MEMLNLPASREEISRAMKQTNLSNTFIFSWKSRNGRKNKKWKCYCSRKSLKLYTCPHPHPQVTMMGKSLYIINVIMFLDIKWGLGGINIFLTELRITSNNLKIVKLLSSVPIFICCLEYHLHFPQIFSKLHPKWLLTRP